MQINSVIGRRLQLINVTATDAAAVNGGHNIEFHRRGNGPLRGNIPLRGNGPLRRNGPFKGRQDLNNVNRAAVSPTRRHEMLVVLQTLVFIESNGLMSRAKLNQVRRDIQRIFIGESEQQEMLPRLNELVRQNHDLRLGFGEISQITGRISQGTRLVDGKLQYLITYIQGLDKTADESAEFFTPLINYMRRYRERLQRFDRDLLAYLAVHEERARATHEFRIAERASEKLRMRLSAKMQQFENELDQEGGSRDGTTDNFDHENAQHRLDTTEKDVIAMARQMLTILSDMKALCQMAMNADMRDTVAADRAEDMDIEDVFAALTDAIHRHPRVASIAGFIVDHFRLIQRTYGLFKVDFENFEQAVLAMPEHATEYFDAIEDDQDLVRKNHHLLMYACLIPYLENIETFVGDADSLSLSKWTKRLTEEISRPSVPWAPAAEALVVALVAAQADLAAQQGY